MARRRNPASGFPPYAAPGASLFSSWHRNRADVMFCLPLYGLALPLPAPLFFQGSREKKVESSAWSLCSGLPLSTAENRRALPECESRFFLPIPYLTGALKHASHALPSPPSSLLSTLEAHCKVTTHYFLPSSPYSLPSQARPSAPATHYLLLPPLYSLLYHALHQSRRRDPFHPE